MGAFLILLIIKRFKMTNPEQPGQINIEISEEVSEGEYANLAIITHSHAEFVIDFVNVMPGTPKSKVKSRIILTPFHAKRFMKAMVENVKKFETANGTIRTYLSNYVAPSPTQKAKFRIITHYNNDVGNAGNDRIIDEYFTQQ